MVVSNSNGPGPKPEITTVFVGNITDKASDTLIRQILMKCGNIISWKRVQGASGRLQGFGFCEYSDPEAGLRAMRLLSGFQVADKKLLVKVDSKTRKQLDEYKEQKKIEKEVIAGHSLDNYDVETDTNTKTTDDSLMSEIEKLLRDHVSEMDSNILHNYKKTHSGNAENLQGLDMNDDTKNLVAKEIRGFRETYKEEKSKEKDKRERDRSRERDKSRERSREREKSRERDRERESEREREREKERQREKEREREREREKEREKERERDRERERERRRREREEREDRDRDRDRDRERERRRDRDREGSGTPSRSRRSRSREPEKDDDDDYEKKRMERIRRDKETFYTEKLKEWEARERKKTRDYEKIFSKDDRKNKEEVEEKHRLREFLEDYDDDRDDVKYYKGSALARRMRDRELEIQSDARDKQREMEEIEEVLRKQMAGETIDTKHRRISEHNKENENTPSKDESQLNPNLRPAAFSAVQSEDNSPAQPDSIRSISRSPEEVRKRGDSSSKPFSSTSVSSLYNDESRSPTPSSKKFGFGMKIGSSVANKNKLGAVFNANEDEANVVEEPKKKLSRLDEDDTLDSKKESTVEDKRKLIKNLIEKIPTVKEELFRYSLNWDIVDEALVDKRIKPWVNKKIFEYIGEEEQTLVDFICSKVLSKCNAKEILEDVAMVLDDESEVFVVKMWRLLIYETEAKKLGLVK